MKISHWVRKLLSPTNTDEDVKGAPASVKEFEKQFVRNKQDELERTLQILEVEVEVVSRK
jgi:hypothetical protein